VDVFDYELLTRVRSGHLVFQPAEPTDAPRRAFPHTAARVLALRERGLLHLARSRRLGRAAHRSLASNANRGHLPSAQMREELLICGLPVVYRRITARPGVSRR
jgi:hypothetical protein